MSEKLKPNFTAIPNVIFDEFLRTMAPGATKIIFAICRLTYGWGKRSDRISLNKLAEMTGMDRANVSRSVKRLGKLILITPGDRRKNLAAQYEINVDVSDSDLVSKAQQGLVSNQQQAVVRPVVNLRPSKEIPKKEDGAHHRARKQPHETDPRLQTLIFAFVTKYLARVGAPYVFLKGKDPALLKRLLTAGHDSPAIEAAMDRYFADDFYSKTGFDVGGFAKAFNRLNSAGAKQRHNYEQGAFPEL